MHEQRKKSTHLVMAGALVASSFVGACDCTTFGLDPIAQTTETTTLAATTTAMLPTTTEMSATTAAPTSANETAMGVLTGTLTVDATSTNDESDTSSTDTSMTADQASSGSSGGAPPEAPVLHLEFTAIKQFDFSWSAVAGADFYRLLEQQIPEADYVQLGDDIFGEAMSWTMPLHLRHEASYILRACNSGGCTDSDEVEVNDPLAAAIGYFKPNVSDMNDHFGYSVDLSSVGDTLVVGAASEDGAGVGPDADPLNNDAGGSGAVSVFVRMGSEWSHQEYIKASNTGINDAFGLRVALSSDGDTLAASALFEDGSSSSVNGADNDGATDAGAVYVFVRDGMGWTQQAYVKPSNTDANDYFGISIALSGNGDTLVVGADYEDSAATIVDGDDDNDNLSGSGAAYVFTRTGDTWQQTAYLKASNPGKNDYFGKSVAVSEDGAMIAVGADGKDGGTGAVYVFGFTNTKWSQQAYITASNAGADDRFGEWVALSAVADTLAVGASWEDSAAKGINNGDPNDDSAIQSGAAYVFVRTGMMWQQQAHVKAGNTRANALFGQTLDLSASGDQLVVTSQYDGNSSVGVSDGSPDNLAVSSGTAYVFVRTDGEWVQRAQVKASNVDVGDHYGFGVSLAGDGETLAITSSVEQSEAVGIGGDQTDNSLVGAGACYLY